MPDPTPRALTQSERLIAVYVFKRIHNWKKWVHRRVESVELTGTVTYQRRVSVDFTIPREKSPLIDRDDNPIFVIPLGLSPKSQLRNFSLRDERGASLPLLTSAKNGAIATGVLVEAAQSAVKRAALHRDPDDDSEPGEPPSALYDELWTIAHGSTSVALEALERLTHTEAPDEPEGLWRVTLARDLRFRELVLDLARNFLVLTVLPGEFDQRRVVKLDYEEQGQSPQGVLRARWNARRERGRRGRAIARHRRETDTRLATGGRDALEVKVRNAGGDQAANVVVSVLTPGATGVVVDEIATGHDGQARFALEPGHYEVEMRPPDGNVDIVRGGRHPVVVPGRPLLLRCQPARFSTGPADGPRLLKLQRRVARAIAWRPRFIAIPTPGVGHCTTFHIEVDAPDGLKITMARLAAQDAGGATDLGHQAQEHGPIQRTHLHLSGVPQSASATCMVFMRPRASLIVRMGFLSAMVTTLLVLSVLVWHGRLSGVVGAIASVLLFVPGGLAAYTARPRENSLTSSSVYGLRFLAVLIGAVSLLAAVTLLLGRDWKIGPTSPPPVAGATAAASPSPSVMSVQPGDEWGGLEWVLGALLLIAAGTAFVFAVTWFFTWRPPEQRPNHRKATA